jgi:hypothetical protein
MWTLDDFYQSKEWRAFRDVVIAERLHDDGLIYDEVTGKPIVKAYDIILHHKVELTEENVNDRNISLNPENIMIVSHKTHNIIHDKLGYNRRQVYVVYGAPCAGKKTFVRGAMQEGDMIVDIDALWRCVSGMEGVKPNRLKAVVFRLRNELVDVIKYRFGKWNNAYVIGGYPLQTERERLVKELGAREVFIETPIETCMERAEKSGASDVEALKGFIQKWFEING